LPPGTAPVGPGVDDSKVNPQVGPQPAPGRVGTNVRVGTGNNARPRGPVAAVGNVALAPPAVLGNPVLGGSGASSQGCPIGFYEQNITKQNVADEDQGPLFKYVYHIDVLKDYDIDKIIYVRVARSMIEAVILGGTKEFHVKVLAFFLNHVSGQLFVNTPTDADSHKLKLVMAVKDGTKTSEVAAHLLKNVDPNKHPIHFLLYANWQVDESSLMPLIISDGTTRRLVRAYKRQSAGVRDEY
jgi:hypothetical protein